MCRGKGWGLCPVSFGLALGIVAGVFLFLCAVWMLYHGAPAHSVFHNLLPLTWGGVLIYGLVGIVEGFLFGFFTALLYDCFVCCCKARCCHPNDNVTGCDCNCHRPGVVGKRK